MDESIDFAARPSAFPSASVRHRIPQCVDQPRDTQGVLLAFEYLGVDAGTQVHVYFGYTLFTVWALVFWSLAFKYLMPRPSPALASIGPPVSPMHNN